LRGVTFPLGVHAVVRLILAKSTNVASIADFGVVLVAMLAVFWLIVAARTAIGA
jgi:tellurite resistance protein TehA-like permease